MTCTVTQADLGKLAENLDADVADAYIAAAKIVVLGPSGACQTETYLAWIRCCVDPCRAIIFLAQHLIASDPASGAGNSELTSKRVGGVAVTYGSATSSSKLLSSTTYGRMYSLLLGKFERCSARRTSLPFASDEGLGC